MNFSSKYVFKKQQKQQRARTEHDNNTLSNINDWSFAENSFIFQSPMVPIQHQQPQTALPQRLEPKIGVSDRQNILKLHFVCMSQDIKTT